MTKSKTRFRFPSPTFHSNLHKTFSKSSKNRSRNLQVSKPYFNCPGLEIKRKSCPRIGTFTNRLMVASDADESHSSDSWFVEEVEGSCK